MLFRSLPLHLAASRDAPDMNIMYTLVDAYREGVFDLDYEGNRPFDKCVCCSTIFNASV